MYFPDLNSNSHDNLNNMKLDLNVSAKVKFSSENDQDHLEIVLAATYGLLPY